MSTLPLHTREQFLPFDQLSWQHFEGLCLRLVRLDQSIEHTQPYGIQGDEQGGIDIYARHRDDLFYTTYQCKNEKDFGPAKIREAVDVFLRGSWAKQSARFVLCTRESMASKLRADEVEKQAKRFKEQKIAFVLWDQNHLSAILKSQPEIVEDFFGRPWVEAFCGDEEVARLGNRITSQQSEAALQNYSSFLFKKIGRVAYRGIADQPSGEKPIELPLERVYVQPLLVPEDERDAHRSREREVIRLLQDPDLDEVQQTALETEFRALKMVEWFELPFDWQGGWAMSVRARSRQIDPVTLQDALTATQSAVVLGAPGSGKSTLLRWVALMCVRARLQPEETNFVTTVTDSASPLPVLISLSAFANALKSRQESTLRGFITSHLNDLKIDHLDPLFAAEFAKGKCWILLDGVDEVADAPMRAEVVKAIESFLAGLGDNRCLLTSRVHGYERVTGLPHFYLRAMDANQGKEFVFGWNFVLEQELNSDEPDVERSIGNTSSLIEQIEENKHLSTLATNPLLLVALLLIHRQNQRLPKSRVEIYHAMTYTLLDTWNLWRSESRYDVGGQVLTTPELLQVLGKVALWSRREKPSGILRRGELERQFVAACRGLPLQHGNLEQTARSYLNAAVEQAGLLEERAPGIFAFWHPTFEEFLSACELTVPSEPIAPKLLALRMNSYWREVILLSVALVGIINDDQDAATELVRALARVDLPVIEPILHPALRLAVACITDNPSLSRDLIQELLLELTQALTHQPYEPLGGDFVNVTDVLPSFKPYPALVEALSDLADLNHAMGTVRTATYCLLSNVAATNERAKQLCWRKCEIGLDKDYPFKDVMARFYATLGCVRAGLYPPYALTNLTGTNQGIFHIARAVELLDLDERVSSKDLAARKKNLGYVRAVLNQPIPSTSLAATEALPEQEIGDIMEPLSAALLLTFAGDNSKKVYEVFAQALQPKYDASGVVFDAAHAPLMFGFVDEEHSVSLQRLSVTAFRRWFFHDRAPRRLHAGNEMLSFVESWEQNIARIIEQIPEYEGRVEEAKVEEAKKEAFSQTYGADRQTLRNEGLAALRSCLDDLDLQGRMLAAEFLLRRGEVESVANAIEGWVRTRTGDFHPLALGPLMDALTQNPLGKEFVISWLRGNDDWLRFVAAGVCLPQKTFKLEAHEVIQSCLTSSLVEIRSSAGTMLTLFTRMHDEPMPSEVETALRSCLGSEEGDASRNAAATLYLSGFKEEGLLPYLIQYMMTQKVGERFDTLRALQEHDAEMALFGPYLEKLGQQNPTARAAFEKVQSGLSLNDDDISTLKAFVQRQPGEDHDTYFYRRCFYDWIWFNLEIKNQRNRLSLNQ